MISKYNKYLKSEWWKGLRRRRLKKNNICEACFNPNDLQIHHFNYKFKYSASPSKAIKHTTVLCDSCHKAFHETYGVKFDMTKEMDEFLLECTRARSMVKEANESCGWIKTL